MAALTLPQKLNPGVDKTPGLVIFLDNNTESDLDHAFLYEKL